MGTENMTGFHQTHDKISRLNRTIKDGLSPGVKRAMFRSGIFTPPFRTQADVTDHCNFKCPTCSKSSAKKEKSEMNLNQWKFVLEKVRDVPLFREISISGGEPFIRSDIFDILGSARENKLKTVIVSNGWFVDREAMKELDKMEVACLIISLNSLDRNIHDRSRGTPGSYDRIMACIENWKHHRKHIRLCLSTVVMEQNCDELLKIAGFAEKHGLNGVLFQVLAHPNAHYAFSETDTMPGTRPTWYRENPFWIKRTATLGGQVHDLLVYKKQKGIVLNPSFQLKRFVPYYENPHSIVRHFCLGAFSRLYIDPYGDIRLCYGYPPIGNILRDEPLKIWKGKKARKIRTKARTCKRSCRLLNNNL
jgi:MoaA/NifB/PqqE/SkfB family radical SAM enzyme